VSPLLTFNIWDPKTNDEETIAASNSALEQLGIRTGDMFARVALD
jgi:hypothetical protein